MAKLLNPVTYYRTSRWLYLHHVPLLPKIVKVFGELLFHCEIPYTATIGDGLDIQHRGFGIVVHPRAELGRNVVLSPCVTIGGRNGKFEVPKIGNDVFIAAGAKILGDVTIGDGSVIGANAVVTRSVPARCVAAGVPARVIRENIRTSDHTGLPEAESPSGKPQAKVMQMKAPAACVEQDAVRVLLFIHSLELGGSEKQCVEVAARLAKDGYSVTVGCLQAVGPLRARLQSANVPLVEFPTPRLLRPNALTQMFRFVRFLRKNKFQVVHTNDLYSNLFAIPAAKIARVPMVISSQRDLSHWWWYTPARRRLIRKIQAMSNWLVVNSDAIRDDLVAKDGFDARKIRVIRNGIDAERFAGQASANREGIPGVTAGDKLVVMVANMHIPVKGHFELIAAAEKVYRRHRNVRFLLVGDGELRHELERLVEERGLEECVLFFGHSTDVPRLLSGCDIGVLASRAEGLPNAVLEYMAAGLATVATTVGGVPEIIQDQVTGLLVPPQDAERLAVAIDRLLEDDVLRGRLGAAAREFVLVNFGFKRVLRQFESLYRPATVQHSENADPQFADDVTVSSESKLSATPL